MLQSSFALFFLEVAIFICVVVSVVVIVVFSILFVLYTIFVNPSLTYHKLIGSSDTPEMFSPLAINPHLGWTHPDNVTSSLMRECSHGSYADTMPFA